MAIVAEEKKDENQQNAPAPVTGGTGPTVQPGGGRTASFSSGAQPSKGSGRFTNLQSYIKANEGAGQQLGSKIGAGLEKEVKKASDTTQAQNIGQQVEKEKERLAQGQQFKTQLGQETGAQAIAGNQETAGQFSKLLNNQNVASNLMQQAQQAQTQQNIGLQQAQQNVQQLGTEAGRFNLLKGAVKNPNYTSGQQRLDQLFLQAGSPQQLIEKQRALTGQVGQAGKQLETMYGQLGTDIGAAGTQAEEVSKMLRGELGTQTENLTEAQRKEAEELNKQNVLRNAALETYFKSGLTGVQDPAQQKYIQDMLQAGGLQSGMRTYNVLKEPDAYKKYATIGGVGYKAADVLNEQEFQRYEALRKLAEAQGPGEFTGAGAGGVATDFRGQNLASDIKAARGQLESNLNTEIRRNIQQSGNTGYYAANALDLLKYQEGNDFGSLYGGKVVPIYGNVNNWNVGTADSNRITGHQAGTIDPGWATVSAWNQQISDPTSVAGSQQALMGVINDYLNRINEAGYNNTLGNVASPTPTDTFKVK